MTGIIVIDKPEGITSFGAVAGIRRICKEKKCGHSGTLDPMATGVMTVLLGGATRFCELLPSHDKAYSASFRLGTVTDTLDITGTVLETREVNAGAEDVKKAAAEFTGEITQLPPMYSAVSVDGHRLYELARKGIEAERPERKVTVYSIEFTDENPEKGEYTISVDCSSGTYIRTLISDIGEKLGCGAVLTGLRRTAANGFTLADAVTLEELEKDPGAHLIPVEKAMEFYPAVTVTEAQAKRFSNGGELFTQRLSCDGLNGLCRVLAPGGTFIGIGEFDGTDTMKVKRVFHSSLE